MTKHGTAIEWTHLPGFKGETWNPVTGCKVVSPGCTNCYAMRVAGERLKSHDAYKGLTRVPKAGSRASRDEPGSGLRAKSPVWTGDVRLLRDRLTEPLRWKKPRSVFVNSMGDLFHEAVPDTFIDRVFGAMALATDHVFMILTKRPERMRAYLLGNPQAADRDLPAARVVRAARRLRAEESDGLLPWEAAFDWPLPNVWLGVSVEDQARADERIPLLLATPAAKRFVSCEPLLGAVDLGDFNNGHYFYSALTGNRWHDAPEPGLASFERSAFPKLDWVIAGGESGPSARPSHRDWFCSLRDQCAAAGTPFFFKQWGEWIPIALSPGDDHIGFNRTRREDVYEPVPNGLELSSVDQQHVVRIGKRAAGSTLDGRQHLDFPQYRTGGRS